MCIRDRENIEMKCRLFGISKKGYAEDIPAVSYTHLDVYKRQVQSNMTVCRIIADDSTCHIVKLHIASVSYHKHIICLLYTSGFAL